MGLAKGTYSVGICGRCNSKVPYPELREDGNIPGFYVCQDPGCYDNLNPYKKAPRQPDNIGLQHPRPDIPVTPEPTVLADPDIEYALMDEVGNIISPS